MNMQIPGRPEVEVADMRDSAITTEPRAVFTQSLKTKGYLFNILLLSYILLIVVFALSHSNQPLEQLEQYQKIQRAQEALAQADLAAFHIVTVLFSDVNPEDLDRVVGYFSSLRNQYINLQRWFPEQADAFRELVATIPTTADDPGEGYLRRIQFHLARSKSQLDRLRVLNQQRLERVVEDYRAQNTDTIVNTMMLGITGLIFLGGLISVFISQLKRDIQFLQRRTAEIVEGYRGKPLEVYRQDEVGQLTEGVNFMANALAEREKALEIQRNKASFVEKMVAIDSLAGGIAHEVGNPIAAIMGLAEEIRNDESNRLSENSRENLRSIIEYSDGLVKLTRELSAFDTHKGEEFEWLNLNQLITNTYNIFHYDQRWSGIHIELELDQSIPAIHASLSQLTQLMNNLLDNARDALRDIEEPFVKISTGSQGPENLLISVEDNGSGMDKSVLEHIFDPFFSTKPLGRSTGLGLSVCWTIAKNHNGIIHAESSPGKGSIISIVLPVAPVETGE